MKITGIIMECNPFHEGHRYLLKKARKETGADRVVVVMSGNFVQRGAPAVMNKETRTRELLENGADLVLELPLYAACAGADYFARGGIALLNGLGCVDSLCFGSESGDTEALMSYAAVLAHEGRSFQAALQDGLRRGLTYPQARDAAAQGILHASLPATPNDLLAVEYCKAIRLLESPMAVYAVRRIPAPSASQLREAMLAGAPIPISLQNTVHSYCRDHILLSQDSLSQALLYALIRAASEGALTQYLDVSRELSDRIENNLCRFVSFSSFCALIKTRNITYTRVSRALTHILLGMTKDEMQAMEQYGMAPYARPLGFKKESSDLLHVISQNSKIPFLSRLSGAGKILPPGALSLLERELFSDLLYELVSCPGGAVNEFQKRLVII